MKPEPGPDYELVTREHMARYVYMALSTYSPDLAIEGSVNAEGDDELAFRLNSKGVEITVRDTEPGSLLRRAEVRKDKVIKCWETAICAAALLSSELSSGDKLEIDVVRGEGLLCTKAFEKAENALSFCGISADEIETRESPARIKFSLGEKQDLLFDVFKSATGVRGDALHLRQQKRDILAKYPGANVEIFDECLGFLDERYFREKREDLFDYVAAAIPSKRHDLRSVDTIPAFYPFDRDSPVGVEVRTIPDHYSLIAWNPESRGTLTTSEPCPTRDFGFDVGAVVAEFADEVRAKLSRSEPPHVIVLLHPFKKTDLLYLGENLQRRSGITYPVSDPDSSKFTEERVRGLFMAHADAALRAAGVKDIRFFSGEPQFVLTFLSASGGIIFSDEPIG